MKRYASVNEYIEGQELWTEQLQQLREILLSTELQETIKWGAPVYTINNKNVVGMGAFKTYAGLWFYNGALLKDEDQVLINAQEGKTKALRQWRFSDTDKINRNKVLTYVLEAIDNQKNGRELKPQKKRKMEIPGELAACLSENAELKSAFETLAPYKQREYAEYIDSAKREATRQSRCAKSVPMILLGIGLHDKYRNC